MSATGNEAADNRVLSQGQIRECTRATNNNCFSRVLFKEVTDDNPSQEAGGRLIKGPTTFLPTLRQQENALIKRLVNKVSESTMGAGDTKGRAPANKAKVRNKALTSSKSTKSYSNRIGT